MAQMPSFEELQKLQKRPAIPTAETKPVKPLTPPPLSQLKVKVGGVVFVPEQVSAVGTAAAPAMEKKKKKPKTAIPLSRFSQREFFAGSKGVFYRYARKMVMSSSGVLVPASTGGVTLLVSIDGNKLSFTFGLCNTGKPKKGIKSDNFEYDEARSTCQERFQSSSEWVCVIPYKEADDKTVMKAISDAARASLYISAKISRPNMDGKVMGFLQRGSKVTDQMLLSLVKYIDQYYQFPVN